MDQNKRISEMFKKLILQLRLYLQKTKNKKIRKNNPKLKKKKNQQPTTSFNLFKNNKTVKTSETDEPQRNLSCKHLFAQLL